MDPKITNTSVQLKYAAILAGLALVGLVIFAAANDAFQRVSDVWWQILVMSAVLFSGSFAVIRAWAVVRHHPHEGWRRVIVIVGTLGLIGGCAIAYESQYGRTSAEDVFEIAIGGLLGFAVSTVAVTFFSWLVRWVREGFRNKT